MPLYSLPLSFVDDPSFTFPTEANDLTGRFHLAGYPHVIALLQTTDDENLRGYR